VRAEWQDGRRAAEKRDELASPHDLLREPDQPSVDESLAQISEALAHWHRPLPSRATPQSYGQPTSRSMQKQMEISSGYV
jgi:hypothetical protein